MDPLDDTLLRLWELFLSEGGPTAEEEETLLPALVAAGFVGVDTVANTWWFTPAGVTRAEAIESRPGALPDSARPPG